MGGAWVGPLYWIQWAGGRRRLHPRGRRTGPGASPVPGLRAAGELTDGARSLYGACSSVSAWRRFG